MLNFSERLQINIDNVLDFVPEKDILDLKDEINNHINALHNRTGKGSDFLGWLDLPSKIKSEEIEKIQKVAKALTERIEILVVVGIGGSFLGAKSVIDALASNFQEVRKNYKFPLVLFAGQNMSADYLFELSEVLSNRQFRLVARHHSFRTFFTSSCTFKIIVIAHPKFKSAIISRDDSDTQGKKSDS